jgi:hypothetical protein
MTMGQAAGVAAALSTRERKNVRELSPSFLQEQLRDIGAILE